MRAAEIALLFAYNDWANRRLLDTARALTHEQFTAPIDFPYGTIQETLLHVLTAERSWLSRWQGQPARPARAADHFPDVATLAEQWERDRYDAREYLARLTDDDLQQEVSYRLGGGTPMINVRWTMLLHVVIHGTEHRSEVAAALTGFGYSPGDLDFNDALYELQRHEYQRDG